MLAWFLVIALLGVHGIVKAPGVLAASARSVPSIPDPSGLPHQFLPSSAPPFSR